MNRLFILILVFLCPGAAFSHPGKTDGEGGHRCRSNCFQWGLSYEEYHFHDEDGNPIRIDSSINSAPSNDRPHSPGTGKKNPPGFFTSLQETVESIIKGKGPTNLGRETNALYGDLTSLCENRGLHFILLLLGALALFFLSLMMILKRNKKEK